MTITMTMAMAMAIWRSSLFENLFRVYACPTELGAEVEKRDMGSTVHLVEKQINWRKLKIENQMSPEVEILYI